MKCPDCHEPMESQEDLVWHQRQGRLVPGPTMWSCDGCSAVFEERGNQLVRISEPEPVDVVMARR